MKTLIRFILFSLLAMSLTGCMALQAPPYEPAIANYDALEKGNYKKISIGDFTLAKKELNEIGLRACTLKSPLNDSFSDYVRSAFEEEFYKAGMLSESANCLISGIMVENEIDTGLPTAKGTMAATITIQEKGQTIFDKTLRVTHTWPSHFLGDIAITRGQQNYPTIVRKFINALVVDPDFQKAMAQ